MSETNQNAKLEEEPMATSAEAEAAEETAAEKTSATEAKTVETEQTAETAPSKEGGEEQTKEAEAEAKEPEPEPDYKAQLAELQDKYLRKLAEFDNYRKRMAREFSETRDQARRTTVGDFLTVYDYFSMGMAAIEQASDMAVLKQGMEMIWAEFQRVLEGLNVKEIESIGKKFDATVHEAMSQEASDTVPEGVVIRQWKAGFMMGDKLLRPAMVVVSTGKPAKPEPAKESEQEEGQKIHVITDDDPSETTGNETDTVSES
ncbi:MAG: nucleotide exchange factor GrpE [Victivallales bacterium]|nr:nucleotide exchange factor GrpE [Victivallales bacterium]